MVQSAESGWYCNLCLTEWTIEPEPRYSSKTEWADISDGGAVPEVKENCVRCPFCGSDSVSRDEI